MNGQYIVTFLYAPMGQEHMNNIISQLAGVRHAKGNKYVKSILDIEYDPKSITSSSIVNEIKQQGLQVALVAM